MRLAQSCRAASRRLINPRPPPVCLLHITHKSDERTNCAPTYPALSCAASSTSAGGEPMLHPLIFELIAAAKAAGLFTSMVCGCARSAHGMPAWPYICGISFSVAFMLPLIDAQALALMAQWSAPLLHGRAPRMPRALCAALPPSPAPGPATPAPKFNQPHAPHPPPFQVTNGSRLDAAALLRLAPSLDQIAFSVDASSDDIHVQLGRGVGGTRQGALLRAPATWSVCGRCGRSPGRLAFS